MVLEESVLLLFYRVAFFSLRQRSKGVFSGRCLLLVTGFSHRVYRAKRWTPMYIRFVWLLMVLSALLDRLDISGRDI
jgi:hypothetical protein